MRRDAESSGRTWNQKNLDYEIETGNGVVPLEKPSDVLKSKEPRLRDWNV